MPHGSSWFALIPGYEHLNEAARAALGLSFLNKNPIDLQHVLAAGLVVVVVLLLSLRTRSAINSSSDAGLVPEAGISVRNFFELVSEALYGQMRTIMGPEAKRYFPVIGTLALFIFFSNVLGLVPGFTPPTDNLNTTAACGVFVFIYYNFHGLRVNGFGHIVHMMNPSGTTIGWVLSPLVFLIELIGHFARPLSLSLRLMGNMVGDHAVLSIFVGIFPWFLPLPFFVLGLLVCVVQTVVFCILSTVYVSLSIAEAHHDDHGDAHKAHDNHGAHAAAAH